MNDADPQQGKPHCRDIDTIVKSRRRRHGEGRFIGHCGRWSYQD